MFEFSLDFGPFHFRLNVSEPGTDGGEYVDLASDTQLAEEDVEYDEPEDHIGFRGTTE